METDTVVNQVNNVVQPESTHNAGQQPQSPTQEMEVQAQENAATTEQQQQPSPAENQLPIAIEPPQGRFRPEGETQSFMILNPAQQRYAFKVKTNNVEDWRVRPVFGFLEPESQLELQVQRLPDGHPGQDRLAIQCANATAEMQDAKEVFRTGGNEIIVGQANLTVHGD